MLTEKDYCDYDTCVALKELGFNDPTNFYYGGDGKYITIHGYWRPELIQRFSLYEAQRFLREEKGIIVYPQYLPNCQTWMCVVYEEKKMLMHSIGRGCYNEVLNKGIKKAVKILKENGYGKDSNTCQ